MPEAGEVFLVWGINGWVVVSEEIRPPGTAIKNKVMHTPMAMQGEVFSTSVRVPSGTSVDYGFLITKKRDGTAIKPVWEANNNQDYHTTVTKNNVVEVNTAITLSQDQSISRIGDAPLVTQEVRYYVAEAEEVSFVWGINKWTSIVPLELRPPGTVVKDAVLYTPMNREGKAFITKVQVPVGTSIDYGFSITKVRPGATLKWQWKWDGDFRVIAAKDSVIELKAKPARMRAKNLSKAFHLGLYLLLVIGIIVGICLLIRHSSKISSLVRKGVYILAVNSVAIIVFMFSAEVFLAHKGFEKYVRTFPGQHENDLKGMPAYAQIDSMLGWVSNKKNYPEMNPQGFRDTKDFNTIDLSSGKKRVMILGDSFMWGAGVKIEETVASRLQQKLQDQFEFYNLSVPGWGIDQMYLAYQRYRDAIVPDMVILAFIDDDIDRVLEAHRIWEHLNKPCFTIKDGELIQCTSVSKGELFLNKLMGKSIFLSLIMHQIYSLKEAIPIVNQIFLSMTKETQERNEKFVVVRIPTQDYASKANINQRFKNFEVTFKDKGALYLEPFREIKQTSNWLTEYYHEDGHMSAAGNEFLADYIYRHVFEASK
jgi:hypothetical protein